MHLISMIENVLFTFQIDHIDVPLDYRRTIYSFQLQNSSEVLSLSSTVYCNQTKECDKRYLSYQLSVLFAFHISIDCVFIFI